MGSVSLKEIKETKVTKSSIWLSYHFELEYSAYSVQAKYSTREEIGKAKRENGSLAPHIEKLRAIWKKYAPLN